MLVVGGNVNKNTVHVCLKLRELDSQLCLSKCGGKIIIKYSRNPLFSKNWGSLLVGYLEKSVKARNPTK